MMEASNIGASIQPSELRRMIAQLRKILARFPGAPHAADALASNFDRWRLRELVARREAIAQIAVASGWAVQLLDESIDALLAPFSPDALRSFASTARPRAQLGGFIMPANVPGAGLHELVATLISGAAAIVKTSSREAVFFRAFVRTLREIDPVLASRVEVTAFSRERTDLTRVLSDECDFLVALGEDATFSHLAGAARLFGFGSRASGALISLAGPANVPALAYAVARDVTFFEQQGCLSPHHVFVEDADGRSAPGFAKALGDALTMMATTLPPAKLSFNAAAAIRRIRERARWRGIGEHQVELFEGEAMSWTVVFDPSARFTISPGYRTVTVSAIRDPEDLAARLAPMAGRLEAFALAAQRAARTRLLDVLAGAGVTYVCDPGKMQAPPLNWPHGGGAFLDFLTARDE
jgi:hypothetical protein